MISLAAAPDTQLRAARQPQHTGVQHSTSLHQPHSSADTRHQPPASRTHWREIPRLTTVTQKTEDCLVPSVPSVPSVCLVPVKLSTVSSARPGPTPLRCSCRLLKLLGRPSLGPASSCQPATAARTAGLCNTAPPRGRTSRWCCSEPTHRTAVT